MFYAQEHHITSGYRTEIYYKSILERGTAERVTSIENGYTARKALQKEVR